MACDVNFDEEYRGGIEQERMEKELVFDVL